MTTYQPRHTASAHKYSSRKERKAIEAQWGKTLRVLGTSAMAFSLSAVVIAAYVAPQEATSFGQGATSAVTSQSLMTSAHVQGFEPAIDLFMASKDKFTAEELREIQAVADKENGPSAGPWGAIDGYPSALAMLDNETANHPFIGAIPVTDTFRSRGDVFHYATDYGTPSGTKLYPLSYGIVSFAYSESMGGNILAIDYMIDGTKYRSEYAHLLDSSIRVKPGQVVTPTTVVAESGNTGTATTGPHLHFGLMNESGEFIDPEEFLQTGKESAGPPRGQGPTGREGLFDENGLPVPPKEEEEEEESEKPKPSEDPSPSPTDEPSTPPTETEDPSTPPTETEEPSDPDPSTPTPSNPTPSNPPTETEPPAEPNPSTEPEPSQDPEVP